MRYLFWGVLSLFLTSCDVTNVEVCREFAAPAGVEEISRSSDRLTAKTREATVELVSLRPQGMAYGTGTLFTYKGHTIVITAAHVVGGTGNPVMVTDGVKEASAGLVYYDEEQDIAVLTLDSPLVAKAMPLRPAKMKSLKIGEEVLYSGYPNVTGLFTIRGYIAGVHPSGHLYLHSYAFSGASGSAVFDTHGRLVGVLYALDVGPDVTGMPTIIEDIVVVVPIWKLQFELLDLNLEV
jgi:S1-C subfamily serine protease